MSGRVNSASAISAAFFIDCAAKPALPPAESGRISATLIWPVPTVSLACGGPDGGGVLLPPKLKRSPPGNPEQAASSAVAAAANATRRPVVAERRYVPAPGNENKRPLLTTRRSPSVTIPPCHNVGEPKLSQKLMGTQSDDAGAGRRY